ncbi:MAG TPA: tyrosine--tRNA ligase [Chthoniobacterales bacterium]|nr:tyrosine--tRNA ligase [Chthoniobacterales bacterium]
MESTEQTIQLLKQGGSQLVNEAELKKKLEEKRPLRVKLGVDPTSPDLHLGHAINLFKLRQFQDFGHRAVLIIGDFTSMVGDPSGRSTTRPMLTREQVMANADTYKTQAFRILDPERTETVFNSEWLGKMNYLDVVRLNSRVTLQQMLQRDDFRARAESGHPVFLHELQYPIMQGWDSVMIKADVELGGTDQLFNIMVGRNLQKEEGQAQQIACIQPILEGLDGVQKMSKSLNNYVGICEPPGEMFGKLMSISDALMARYYAILFGEALPSIHPMEAKKQLASRVVEQFHNRTAAEAALNEFNLRFERRDLESIDLPEVSAAKLDGDIVSVVVKAYAKAFSVIRSRSDARRLVEQGSIQWRGEKVTDPKSLVQIAEGGILRLDKTRAVRVK